MIERTPARGDIIDCGRQFPPILSCGGYVAAERTGKCGRFAGRLALASAAKNPPDLICWTSICRDEWLRSVRAVEGLAGTIGDSRHFSERPERNSRQGKAFEFGA